MNDPVVLAVVAIIAIAVGFGIGFVARSLLASQAIRSAQDKAGRIVAEARAQQKELILQAKDEQVRLARQADEDARSRRNDLSALEKRLLQRDEQLDDRKRAPHDRDVIANTLVRTIPAHIFPSQCNESRASGPADVQSHRPGVHALGRPCGYLGSITYGRSAAATAAAPVHLIAPAPAVAVRCIDGLCGGSRTAAPHSGQHPGVPRRS